MRFVFFMILTFLAIQADQNCSRKTMQNTNETISPSPQKTMKYDRLPPDIEAETEARKDILNDRGEVISFEVMTVEKRLNELGARYEKDILVDSKGREIRFYEPLCRGASAGFEQDQLDRREKEKELAELLKKYTVIVLYCDPAKVM